MIFLVVVDELGSLHFKMPFVFLPVVAILSTFSVLQNKEVTSLNHVEVSCTRYGNALTARYLTGLILNSE